MVSAKAKVRSRALPQEVQLSPFWLGACSCIVMVSSTFPRHFQNALAAPLKLGQSLGRGFIVKNFIMLIAHRIITIGSRARPKCYRLREASVSKHPSPEATSGRVVEGSYRWWRPVLRRAITPASSELEASSGSLKTGLIPAPPVGFPMTTSDAFAKAPERRRRSRAMPLLPSSGQWAARFARKSRSERRKEG